MQNNELPIAELRELLHFFQAAGMSYAVDETPLNAFDATLAAQKHTPQPHLAATAASLAESHTPSEARSQNTAMHSAYANRAAPYPDRHISYDTLLAQARKQAAGAQNLAELKSCIAAFDGCSLKRTAKNTCIADGSAHSDLMLIGEAPGSEEDRQALPFVGKAGQLLNQILAAIGKTRESLQTAAASSINNAAAAESSAAAALPKDINRAPPDTLVYITNAVFWRPPGNRTPTEQEIALCRPFLLRQIELVRPKIIITLGGTAINALLGGKHSVMRIRGHWQNCKIAAETEIPLMPTFHPAYLLRTPLHKKQAWQDFLAVKMRLQNL